MLVLYTGMLATRQKTVLLTPDSISDFIWILSVGLRILLISLLLMRPAIRRILSIITIHIPDRILPTRLRNLPSELISKRLIIMADSGETATLLPELLM